MITIMSAHVIKRYHGNILGKKYQTVRILGWTNAADSESIKWDQSSHKVPYVMCEQRRRWSACAFTQAKQRLCCSINRFLWSEKLKPNSADEQTLLSAECTSDKVRFLGTGVICKILTYIHVPRQDKNSE